MNILIIIIFKFNIYYYKIKLSNNYFILISCPKYLSFDN